MQWWDEEVAATREEVRRRHADNKASWEQAARYYTDRVNDTIVFLRSGGSSLHPIERSYLGELARWARAAIHLQCASGKDTLSLLNEGVEHVVGVDISEVHIRNARRTAAAHGANAEFFCCDVLETPRELDGRFDLVYTGRGAIGWVHDLDAWATVVHRLLRPGGALSLFDDHPASFLFDPDEDHLTYNGSSYFQSAAGGTGWPEGYIADLGIPDDELRPWHDRVWTLAELFAALGHQGLGLEHLGEYPEPYYDAFPRLEPEQLRRIPHTFAILARRPPGDA